MSEIGNEQREKTDNSYALFMFLFCFPVFIKWRDCSSGTHREEHTRPSLQNETRQTAHRCFVSRAHYRRSSFFLLGSFFPLCLHVTSSFHLHCCVYLLSFSSSLALAWIFSPSVPLRVLLNTPPKVNTAWK